ncbi:MAG TPA: acetyl-CoA carboxylase biotin carboxyl carrier protein [Bdellovibrionota bacterium]|nr:acetyl-CoA carboxylase biotin carboxyl carrier protein [Bdellovibrionota bacterium]
MIDLKVFKKILQLIKETDVTEVEICEGEQKIRICRGAVIPNPQERVLRENITPAREDFTHESILTESAQKINQENSEKMVEMKSPFVGTFYRSSSPESEPFVKEESLVKKGDVLCIVEAMKLMNEIESEVEGKILSILVENGEPVEFGQPLFKINLLD